MLSFKETSKPYTKEELEKAGVNWQQLTTCVSNLTPIFENVRHDYDIEESAPFIGKETFTPNSWVGVYPSTNLRIDPSKIDEEEYSSMKKDVINWIQTLGSPFFEMLLKCFPSEVMEMNTLYTLYSRMLISYTEILITHQLPREAIIKNLVGREPRGRILWGKTAYIQQRDPYLMAMRQTRFTFDTLPNLLLTQFHARISRGLQEVTKVNKEVDKNRRYHLEFIGSGLPADLLDESLETDFSQQDIIERSRKLSSTPMHDVIDLWESFLSRRAHLLNISERIFDGAIKPMSKIYELWCLKILYEALEELTGITPDPPKDFPCEFNFEDLQLYYNKPVYELSGIMNQLGKEPGVPDFLLSFKNGFGIIADAKYREKHNIEKIDYQRFLSYLLDYLYPNGNELEGIIFHLSEEDEERTISCRGVNIHLIALRPSNSLSAKVRIKGILEKQLKNIGKS